MNTIVWKVLVFFVAIVIWGMGANSVQAAYVCGATGPVMLYPTSGQTVTQLAPTFSWTRDLNAKSYTIQVSPMNPVTLTSDFSYLIVNKVVLGTTYTSAPLTRKNTYYWRVRANYSTCTSDWPFVKKLKFTISPTATL